jgi:hypothetical protein
LRKRYLGNGKIVGEDKNNWIGMRKLKIKSVNPIMFSIDVQNEYLYIRHVAQQYAASEEELSAFYEAGLKVFEKSKR